MRRGWLGRGDRDRDRDGDRDRVGSGYTAAGAPHRVGFGMRMTARIETVEAAFSN